MKKKTLQTSEIFTLESFVDSNGCHAVSTTAAIAGVSVGSCNSRRGGGGSGTATAGIETGGEFEY